MAPGHDCAVVWFRRDLRIDDHAALAAATRAHRAVHAVFVLDPDMLDAQPRTAGRRVRFLLDCLGALDAQLRDQGGGLQVLRGRPADVLPRFVREHAAGVLYANRDFEPAARLRDAHVQRALAALDIGFTLCQDQVLLEPEAVLTRTGSPFSVFTPFRRTWLAKLQETDLSALQYRPGAFAPAPPVVLPELSELGFDASIPRPFSELGIDPSPAGAARLLADFARRIDNYDETRDFPAVKGPSYLAPHLRFGTLSVRAAARLARSRDTPGAEVWLSELAWRDFFFQILAHHPHVVDRAFRPGADAIAWDDSPLADTRFAAWCEGRTGYPVVDAGMRQLTLTGYMHHRLRMIVASFLTKDLHVDWRRGAAHFAALLLDHDLSANNGNWQWAASTGADAQPYFRIFNPVTQSKRFDPEGRFIRRYVPELAQVPDRYVHAPWTMPADVQASARCLIGHNYPEPVVDHDVERRIALARYGRAT